MADSVSKIHRKEVSDKVLEKLERNKVAHPWYPPGVDPRHAC